MRVRWVAHNNGQYKAHKQKIQISINEQDLAAEIRESLTLTRDQLSHLLREKEIKYFQMAKVKDVLLGDNSTRYFQLIANDKYRRKQNFSLDQEKGNIEGQHNLKDYY